MRNSRAGLLEDAHYFEDHAEHLEKKASGFRAIAKKCRDTADADYPEAVEAPFTSSRTEQT